MDQAKEAVADTTANIMQKAEATQEFLTSKRGSFVITAVIAVVAIAFVVLILFWIVNRKVNNRKSHTLQATKVPVVATKFQSFDATGIPVPGNGKRMSFTFWIYIHDLSKYNGLYKNVLYRGDAASTVANASPAVLLDASTNKLHVIFGTEKPDPFDGKKIENPENINKYLVATRGVTIDYIPIQRWVHVGIVVNEEVNGGTLSAYLDGELVKIAKTNSDSVVIETRADGTKVSTALNIQNMNLDKRGNVYVGGSMDSAVPGFSGLVSRIAFFNYDLNARDIYNVYQEGPVDGLASKIGAAYGVRTPVYRLG